MKTHRYLIVLLTILCTLSHTLAQDQKNAALIIIDSKIAAANSHYKTVMTIIADKEAEAKIAKNKGELKQIDSDLAILEEDKKATEEEIKDLVKNYNSLSRKRSN